MARSDRPAVLTGFTVRQLDWPDTELGRIDLPGGTMRITSGFGSGLTRCASDPAGVVWAVCDRGPNLKPKVLVKRHGVAAMKALTESGAKVMPRPDLGPALAKLRVEDDRVDLVEEIRLTRDRAEPVSGLPIPGGEHAKNEPAYNLDGHRLPADPNGFDTEGIAALGDGGFWLGDEFGPSLVRIDREGRIVARHLPAGMTLEGAHYPVSATLPAIAARRQLNRGFEAIALSADEAWLFLAFQSPLAHPDEAAHEKARHVRIWRLDAASMKVVAHYAYPLDPPDTFLRDNVEEQIGWNDLKVSELISLGDDSLLVLERASKTTKLYKVALSEDAVLDAEHLDPETRPTLEELSANSGHFPELAKTLVLTSDDVPELPADLEGMVALSPTELLLVNDSDFGVEGAATSFWKITWDKPVL